MAGWEEESEVPGDKRGDFRDTTTPKMFKPEGEKPEPISGGPQSLHQNREELLLRKRRSKMSPDPA